MGTFRNKLFYCLVLVSLCSMGLPLLYVHGGMQRELIAEARRQALAEARILAAFLEGTYARDGWEETIMKTLARGNTRLTIINRNGDVLLDSSLYTAGGMEHSGNGQPSPARENGVTSVNGRSPASELELDNHLDRPEVRMALGNANGEGFSVRVSGTQGVKLVYAAVLMQNGSVVRLGRPFADLDRYFYERYHKILMVAGVGMLALLALSYYLAFRLRSSLDVMLEDIGAIASGNYKRIVRKVPGREFMPMAMGIQGMAASIEEQMAVLRDQRGQLETILDTLSDGVLVLGRNGRIRRSNRAMQKAFPETEDSLGKVVAEVIPVPALQKNVTALLAGGATVVSSSEPGVTVNMEYRGRFWSVRMSAVRAEDSPSGGSGGLGAVLVFMDMTDLTRLERTRRDFVANVSHELRTPLTAIQGYAETLAALEGSEPGYAANVRRFGEIIERNSARLSRLVDDLLILSRLENDPAPAPGAETSMAGAVQEAELVFESAMRGKNLTLRLNVPQDLGVGISADHLSQVINNLVDNAVRHSPQGGEIEISAEAESGGTVLLTVRDQGAGIPENDLERIFERFYQVEKHRSRQTGAERENHGLGLSICKHIVERNRGRIWAQSSPTTFFVRLPGK